MRPSAFAVPKRRRAASCVSTALFLALKLKHHIVTASDLELRALDPQAHETVARVRRERIAALRRAYGDLRDVFSRDMKA